MQNRRRGDFQLFANSEEESARLSRFDLRRLNPRFIIIIKPLYGLLHRLRQSTDIARRVPKTLTVTVHQRGSFSRSVSVLRNGRLIKSRTGEPVAVQAAVAGLTSPDGPGRQTLLGGHPWFSLSLRSNFSYVTSSSAGTSLLFGRWRKPRCEFRPGNNLE